MELHILFAQSAGFDEPPTALLVWSEYDVEDNLDGFDQEVNYTIEKHQLRDHSIWHSFKVMRVAVDQRTISRHLSGVPLVAGEVKS